MGWQYLKSIHQLFDFLPQVYLQLTAQRADGWNVQDLQALTVCLLKDHAHRRIDPPNYLGLQRGCRLGGANPAMREAAPQLAMLHYAGNSVEIEQQEYLA